MQQQPTLEPAERAGPASFACAYLNGRADTVPPLLLALDGLDDVGSLLTAAAGALSRGGVDADPKIVFTPDGAVISKAARVSDLKPNCVLILSCGEAFDAASVPGRARRLHASQQRLSQRLGGLVRAAHHQMVASGPTPTRATVAAKSPWKYSPSGRWASPLALHPGYRGVKAPSSKSSAPSPTSSG
jgi:hypothetical protein